MSVQSKGDEAHPGKLATAAVLSLSPYVPGKPIAELAARVRRQQHRQTGLERKPVRTESGRHGRDARRPCRRVALSGRQRP